MFKDLCNGYLIRLARTDNAWEAFGFNIMFMMVAVAIVCIAILLGTVPYSILGLQQYITGVVGLIALFCTGVGIMGLVGAASNAIRNYAKKLHENTDD